MTVHMIHIIFTLIKPLSDPASCMEAFAFVMFLDVAYVSISLKYAFPPWLSPKEVPDRSGGMINKTGNKKNNHNMKIFPLQMFVFIFSDYSPVTAFIVKFWVALQL